MAERMNLAQIRTDGKTQVRVQMSAETISDYAQAYIDSGPEALPAVVVFRRGKDYWLADGFHRLAAAELAGLDEILADVRPGNARDALLYACGANAEHGLRRSAADKRRAVALLLADERAAKWSDRRIAEACKVSATFVGDVRRDQAQLSTVDSCEAREGRDGKSRKTPARSERPAAVLNPQEAEVAFGGPSLLDHVPQAQPADAVGWLRTRIGELRGDWVETFGPAAATAALGIATLVGVADDWAEMGSAWERTDY